MLSIRLLFKCLKHKLDSNIPEYFNIIKQALLYLVNHVFHCMHVYAVHLNSKNEMYE